MKESAQFLGGRMTVDALMDRLSPGAALLAPMSGVTDAVFRRIAHRFGAALVVTEMIASDSLASGDQEALLRVEGAGVTPHVVQLAGCEPRCMADGARIAEASGAAIIDINMGCPAKRVVGGWAGSALMRDLDHAVAIVEGVVRAVSIPVTVKMRLGWDDASRNAAELARRAVAAGAQAVAVHGRTRCQFYKGRADWPAIRHVAKAIEAPVISNGDIANANDARTCLDQSGARGVMIGRAALGKAWLPAAIQTALRKGGDARRPPASVRRDAAIAHYDGLLTLYGREVGLRHARKHVAAYLDDACDGDAGRRARHADALTTANPGEVVRHLDRAFSRSSTEAVAA